MSRYSIFSASELSSSITLIEAPTNKVTHFPVPTPPPASSAAPRPTLPYKLLEFLFLAAQILAPFLQCALHQGLLGD